MASQEIKRPVAERRVFNLTRCEVRAATGDSPAHFTGYAAVFNELSVNLGGFRERIQPGAFRNAVDELQDVRFLINHDSNLILGRTPRTLTLVEDEVGLRVDCDLPDTSYARDLAISMERGDINQMSFGFVTRADDWKVKDAETGLPIRELIEADLFDVSAVTYPAYPDTTAAVTEVRSLVAEDEELMLRAAQAAEEITAIDGQEERSPEELAEAVDITVGDDGTEDDHEAGQRERAGARVEEGYAGCENGFAVVFNFNDEMQSCHVTREAADEQLATLEAAASDRAAGAIADAWKALAEDAAEQRVAAEQEERVGKTLSKKNMETLNAAAELLAEVISAGTKEETIVETVELNSARPDFAAFRAAVEERGWDYDDDWAVWTITQMLEGASCFLLFADDPNDDDAAEDAPLVAGMKTVMSTLAELLAGVVVEGTREGDPEGEEREETPAGEAAEPAADAEPPAEGEEAADRADSNEVARRRLELLERELAFEVL